MENFLDNTTPGHHILGVLYTFISGIASIFAWVSLHDVQVIAAIGASLFAMVSAALGARYFYWAGQEKKQQVQKSPRMKKIDISHIWKAWISTLLGILVGCATTTATILATGQFDKKAIAAGVIPIVLFGITDFLKEVQKMFSEKPKRRKATKQSPV